MTNIKQVTRKLVLGLAAALLATNIFAGAFAFAEEVGEEVPVVEAVEEMVGEEEVLEPLISTAENGISVSVTNGMAVELIDGWSIQLTPSLATKAAEVDSTTRTAYVLLDNSKKALKGYCYDLQKDATFKLFDVAEGVEDFVYNGDVATGYKINGDTVAFPTLQEIKATLGIETGTPDQPSNPSTPDQPTGTKPTLIMRDGNVVVTITDSDSGLKREYTLNTGEVGTVQSAGLTDEVVAIVYYTSGRVDAWHESFGQLYTIVESGATGLVFKDGLVTGIKVGDTVVSYTLAQLKEKIERGGAFAVIYSGMTVKLLNGNDEVVDEFTILKNGKKIKYQGKVRKVKPGTATFNSKGQLVYITGKTLWVETVDNDGKHYREKIAKKVKTIEFNKYGIADYATLKNGTKVDCITGAEYKEVTTTIKK